MSSYEFAGILLGSGFLIIVLMLWVFKIIDRKRNKNNTEKRN